MSCSRKALRNSAKGKPSTSCHGIQATKMKARLRLPPSPILVAKAVHNEQRDSDLPPGHRPISSGISIEWLTLNVSPNRSHQCYPCTLSNPSGGRLEENHPHLWPIFREYGFLKVVLIPLHALLGGKWEKGIRSTTTIYFWSLSAVLHKFQASKSGVE